MRVTNGMIMNTTLSGLYSNMNTLNKTYAQMATGKKIQTVSEDPVIAGRALKLKTTVLETEQHISNAKEAASWMEVTEAALKNMTDILKTVRTKCNQAATGTLDEKDKKAIQTDINQLWNQLNEEANSTYGGRYIFSGYKTSEPLALNKAYKLEADLVSTLDLVLGGASKIEKGTVLEEGSLINSGSVLGAGTEVTGSSTYGKGTILTNADDIKEIIGIDLQPDKYVFDKDTVLKEGTVLTIAEANQINSDCPGKITIPAGATEVTLDKDVTFNKNEALSNTVSKALFNKEGSMTEYELTTSAEYTGTYELKGTATIGVGSEFTGTLTLDGETTLEKGSMLKEGSTLRAGSTLGKGTLNPIVVGNIDNQSMKYEIGAGSTITVNTEGMDDIFLDITKSFNEIAVLMDKALAGDEVNSEQLHEMFTTKLDELDEIMAKVSEVTSDMGSRMRRVDYSLERATDQKLSFENLLSETEDVDIEEVYTNFNIQYAAYQSALQATSKIITNTLADYL